MIREMKIEDYNNVYALWKSIKGFSIRSIDDSYNGIDKFLLRNPNTSVVYETNGRITGTILCGNDGRRGYFYHVCVAEEARMQGVGKAMAKFCADALKKEGITKISLITFRRNLIGNAFWEKIGWTKRDDLNFYDFTLDKENIISINP
ncbi:MAG: GNAT family N-acetyltransferase [Lachnospiraceae bacterium]|nr:GNAT family N-acetyltransferase [Lachnospiraceae bacterium]